MADWVSFYDLRHSLIYVNARHRDVHYAKIAADIRGYIPSPAAHVLDFGCGEATSAELVAEACGQLVLVEAAPHVRASLTMRYAGHPKIAVITSEQAGALPAGTFDLIVLHSVAQYLSGAELDRLLTMFRRLLKPDGTLVLGDIVPPRFAASTAAMTLLRLGAANGFFWAAVFGLIRIFVSDYLRLRKTVGLSHYEETAMLEKLARAGYSAQRAKDNIGHNRRRMTFLARLSNLV
jgi:SAM-dependent methyltransferase